MVGVSRGAGHTEGFVECCKIDEKTAKTVPKKYVRRVLTADEAQGLLKRLG